MGRFVSEHLWLSLLKLMLYRNAMPIQTKSGYLVALLAGRPSSPSWGVKMKALGNAMDTAKSKMSFTKDQSDHQRGTYPTIATGLSYGGGATVSS